MCRHLGYLGPAVPVSSLVLDPPHSLLRQSWAPTDMRHGGTINADGFGVGWYTDTPEPVDWRRDGKAGYAAAVPPVVYRRSTPMWTDAALPGLLQPVRATVVLAAVRSATVGMPVVETAAAPFTDGRYMFSHNGVVRGWPESVTSLAADLPLTDLMTLDAPTDSALLWAVVRHRLQSGVSPEQVLGDVFVQVAELAPDSRLNMMLTDGTSLVATTGTHSLSYLNTGDAVVLASEPYDDDPRWTPIPDWHLVVASPTSEPEFRMRPLRRQPSGNP